MPGGMLKLRINRHYFLELRTAWLSLNKFVLNLTLVLILEEMSILVVYISLNLFSFWSN